MQPVRKLLIKMYGSTYFFRTYNVVRIIEGRNMLWPDANVKKAVDVLR